MKVSPVSPDALPVSSRAVLAALLLILLGLGVFARTSTPNIALLDRDTAGYLTPALSFLSGQGLQQTAGRDWLYPLFLAFSLQTTGSFAGVIVLQKILGLLTGIIIAATWSFWASFLNLRGRARVFVLALGAMPVLFQMINPQMLLFEMKVRPEAVMNFFIFAQFAAILAYCQYRWRQPHPVAMAVAGTLAITLALLNCVLKPSWLLALPPTIAPVFLGLWGRPSSLARWLTPVLGFVLAGLLLWVPGRMLFVRDAAAELVLPTTLLSLHADLIKEDFARELAKTPENQKLARLVEVFQHELQKSRERDHNYERLGFDPDYLRYRSGLPSAVREYAGGTDESYRTFCLNAYRNVALHDPAGLLRKVGNQFTHFLLPQPSTFLKDEIKLAKEYRYAAEIAAAEFPSAYSADVQQKFSCYQNDLPKEQDVQTRLTSPWLLTETLKPVTWIALPLMVAFLVFLLVTPCLRASTPLPLAGWTALLLLSGPAGNALTVALVHALDITRYRVSYGGAYFFALLAIATYLVVVVAKSVSSALRRD